MNSQPLEWLYLREDGQPTRWLYEQLKDDSDLTAEFWDEAGVLEISGRETGFYMEESEEEGVWWVTLSPGDHPEAVSLMKLVEEVCGGRFTVDE